MEWHLGDRFIQRKGLPHCHFQSPTTGPLGVNQRSINIKQKDQHCARFIPALWGCCDSQTPPPLTETQAEGPPKQLIFPDSVHCGRGS